MAMMAMTTNNSISVKPRQRPRESFGMVLPPKEMEIIPPSLESPREGVATTFAEHDGITSMERLPAVDLSIKTSLLHGRWEEETANPSTILHDKTMRLSVKKKVGDKTEKPENSLLPPLIDVSCL